MLAVEDAGSNTPSIIAVIAAFVAVHIVSWAALRFSVVIHRVLGEGGTTLLTKLSGMLLAAIATQLIVNGILGVIEQI